MSDEHPVPETLETIAARIGALSQSMDLQFENVAKRFTKVDTQFAKADTQFAEVRALVRSEIAEVKSSRSNRNVPPDSWRSRSKRNRRSRQSHNFNDAR